MPDLPRGIRNHNPLNIRRTRIDWDGMAPEQTDPDYVQFVAPEWGIRAAVRILRTYQRRGLVTIRQMIAAWAPPEDHNPTEAYAAHVSAIAGVGLDVPVQFPGDLPGIVCGMIAQENGQQPYLPEVIQRGITLGMI